MPDDEKIEQGAMPEAAASEESTGVEEQAPAASETDDNSPIVTFSQKKLDTMFGKVRDEERRKTQELEQRIQRMESERAQQQPPIQQPITVETVLGAYERGQITESQKDQWVIHLAKESAKQEFGQVIGQTAQMMRAQGVVEQYAKALPVVNDTSSVEFQELKSTYQELLNEGYPNNVATQAKALRMTFGPIKPKTIHAGEHTRQRADTFLEGSGGGGSMAAQTDITKNVPERQRQHWKQQGYTKSRMAEEAKFREVKSIEDYRRLARKTS